MWSTTIKNYQWNNNSMLTLFIFIIIDQKIKL